MQLNERLKPVGGGGGGNREGGQTGGRGGVSAREEDFSSFIFRLPSDFSVNVIVILFVTTIFMYFYMIITRIFY